jgi:hypothetical protein
MEEPIRDGLTQWHWEYTRHLLIKLFMYEDPRMAKRDGESRVLSEYLSLKCRIAEHRITDVRGALAVARTAAGVSYYRGGRRGAEELVIDWGGLEAYETEGYYEEYASFAHDPVIGSRSVNHIDDVLLLIIGHELAHHIVALRHLPGEVRPHGVEFQETYRLIREYGVNPLINEFAQGETERITANQQARFLRKVHALRKMSEDRTSNPYEAERALVQLQGLLAKHGIESLQSLGETPPVFVERSVPVIPHGTFAAQLRYNFGIIGFCGVRSVIHTRYMPNSNRLEDVHKQYKYISFFGAPSDVEMALYLSQLIHQSLCSEAESFKQSEAFKEERALGLQSRTIMNSFYLGFTRRINFRLLDSRAAAESAWVEGMADAKALMTQQSSALEAAFKSRYPRLGRASSGRSSSGRAEGAVSAGRSAANKVNLNRPVNQRGTRLLK